MRNSYACKCRKTAAKTHQTDQNQPSTHDCSRGNGEQSACIHVRSNDHACNPPGRVLAASNQPRIKFSHTCLRLRLQCRSVTPSSRRSLSSQHCVVVPSESAEARLAKQHKGRNQHANVSQQIANVRLAGGQQGSWERFHRRRIQPTCQQRQQTPVGHTSIMVAHTDDDMGSVMYTKAHIHSCHHAHSSR